MADDIFDDNEDLEEDLDDSVAGTDDSDDDSDGDFEGDFDDDEAQTTARVSKDLVRLTRSSRARRGKALRGGSDTLQSGDLQSGGLESDTFQSNALVGQLLIATPEMRDSNFDRAVIYLCEFSREGAMGLIINRPAPRLNFSEILRQLGIESDDTAPPIRVQTGGPVGSGHGFVLHSDDYFKESTLRLPDGVALTGTMDILRAISSGDGPRKSFLALGYAGWGAGQLDAELAQNAWLTADCDEDLLFNAALETRWSGALSRIGIRAGRLAPFSGTA